MNPCEKQKLIRDLENDLKRVIDFINNCDHKAQIILATMGIIFTVIFSKPEIISKISDLFKNLGLAIQEKEYLFSLSLLIAFLFLAAGIFFIISSFYNLVRTIKGVFDVKTKEDNKDHICKNNSKIFFRSISNEKYNDFKNQRRKATDDERIDELISQLYINSKICTQKFKTYNKGIDLLLYYGLPFLCIGIILSYLFV